MTDIKKIDFALKRYEEITIAEWLFYCWIEVIIPNENEPVYIKGSKRPFDESIRLAGSLKELKQYMKT